MQNHPKLSPNWLIVLAVLAAASLAIACHDSDHDEVSASAPADVLLGDAPTDSLLAFTGVLQEMYLAREDGAITRNLLADPISVEFLSLEDKLRWLTRSQLPVGTYTAIHLAFAPGSLSARTKSGKDVGVIARTSIFEASMSRPLVVTSDGFHRLEVELDLERSLLGETDDPPLMLRPTGAVTSGARELPVPIEEFRGTYAVGLAGTTATLLGTDAFVDADLRVPLGRVGVLMNADTLLVDQSGNVIRDEKDFYASLQVDLTLLEVHGKLAADGWVRATKIEVEDQAGGIGCANEVKLEGVVVGLEPETGFRLLVCDVEKGRRVAEPILARLGTPQVVAVSVDARTHCFHEADVMSLDSLRVGHTVKVEFDDFVGPPFRACEIEMRHRHPEFDGVVTAVGRPLEHFQMVLDEGSPVLHAGLLPSQRTPVTVDLTRSTMVLATAGSPPLRAEKLLRGVRVEVLGELSTRPEPTIDSARVRVRPGLLRGTVIRVDPRAASFAIADAEIARPFGGDVTRGPVTVIVDPAAVFTGDARSGSDFFELFERLAFDQALDVDVEGLGTGMANEVVAYELDVDVR